MLEVHAPHESVHTFKDALIHIAIIVVGLLIAVALDEAAEHIHHMHQVAETREALRQELDYNIQLFQQTTNDTRWETAEYKNNMLVFEYLQQHPGTPQQKLPGVLLWSTVTTVTASPPGRPPSRAASPPSCPRTSSPRQPNGSRPPPRRRHGGGGILSQPSGRSL